MTDRSIARHAAEAHPDALRRLAAWMRVPGAYVLTDAYLRHELSWKLNPYQYDCGMYRN